MTIEQSNILTKIEHTKSDLQAKYDTSLQEIEGTLLALGTHKRIIAELPEAILYMPANSTNGNVGIMHVPAAIKEKINCLISDDSKCISKL